MFADDPLPHVFALPPGADFARHLVEGLVERAAPLPPEALARTTLYLNTGRMLRRVREMFDRQGTRLLPRLRLITDIGRDPLAGLPRAVGPLRRRLELARLVRRLLESRPGFAAGTAAFALADSLARLMAEMHDEDVPPGALCPELAEDHAAHWEQSLQFIRLVARFFDAAAEPDTAARQRRAAAALVGAWQASTPADPVIIAGSTGSRGTTQMLMNAVARLPRGAVILPGFDGDMPESAWYSLDSGPIPLEDHPQYRFRALLRMLDMRPGEVRAWREATAPDAARNALVSLSLRPPPLTDRWRDEGQHLGDLRRATAGMSLIEAPGQRAEALAIATILRKAAEDGRRAALISADRTLTRRVAAALDRWRIVPDDSAGQPLDLSAAGRFLRLVARLNGGRLAADQLLVVLKHPLAAGGARGEHLLRTRAWELHLRRHGPAFPTGADLGAWAGAMDAGARDWAGWLGGVIDSLQTGPRSLSDWLAIHLAQAETLANGPGAGPSRLWQEAAGVAALQVIEELRREAEAAGELSAADYADLLDHALAAGTVRQSTAAHPLVDIWGTLEARVGGADLVILAGLNEGIWPALPGPDPWMSRQMRLRAGLLLPERQVGLSAHDYQQAAGAPEVVLSRAMRDAESETVASRWLQRLTNLLQGLPAQNGPAALAAMRDRGDGWLRLGRRLEAVRPVPAAPRPCPRPPVEHRPSLLPVTDISALIRDPYAIYARRILRLRPLDPLRASADYRLRGSALHEVAEAFLRHPDRLSMGVDGLLALTETVLERDVPWPAARRFWLARMRRIAASFLEDEAARARAGTPAVIEREGRATLANGFTLTAKADRIDLLHDGSAHVFDYKTGTPPSEKQQKHFDKQMILEAALAEGGGFPGLPEGGCPVSGYSYIHLGGSGEVRTTLLEPGEAAAAWAELGRLIDSFMQRERGYLSRRAVFSERLAGDYDHLARFGEWAQSDAATAETVP